MTWDGEASVQFLLKRREALSLYHPLKTCSASKACEDAGHTGLPPSHTVVLGSLNGQLDFPSEETLVKRSIPWNSLEYVAFDLALQFYMSLFLF